METNSSNLCDMTCQKKSSLRLRTIDSTHSSPRIAASKSGSSSVPMLALPPSSKPYFHAALVHRVHQWPSIWLHGNPTTIDIQDLPIMKRGIYNYGTSISDIKEGTTYSATWPSREIITGNTVTLSTTDPLCVKRCSYNQLYRFTVGFGQCFGQNWIHVICEEPDTFPLNTHDLMWVRAPEHAQSMKKARSGAARCQVYILQTPLPRSTWILQTSCVLWMNSGICGIKLEVFQDSSVDIVSHEWAGFDVDGTYDLNRDWRGLMMPHCPSKQHSELLVDGVSMNFSYTPNNVMLGDYGHLTDSEDFCCEGNLFADIKSLSLKANITPRQHKISQTYGHRGHGIVHAFGHDGSSFLIYSPLGLSLPRDDDFISLSL
ncbi:hypothetical protein SCLCIDRAFT_867081 [Scleroderma citrinum Foug A]|uniref:Uncharacterized protein n=1 Tax=Scleroderma citrinum Foug A TaxID=1036808 RepID=A0A0C3DM51_9AGAM|nr:hypothetical protein SCLCIDRAFT_867081 [Scleroderma citrinum Foug A]